MESKYLYIGTGLHLEPIKTFNSVKEFIFIDSQPRNEYGFNYYYRGFYGKDFVDNLIQECLKHNFKLINKTVFTDKYTEINVPNLESTMLYFLNDETEQVFKYYISTSIPYDLHDNEILIKDISECDTLIISGHHPNHAILDYIKKPIAFIGYSNTWFPKTIQEFYDNSESDCVDIINALIEEDNSIFNKFYYVNKETNIIINCNDYKHFLSIQKSN